jgi:ribosomal protein L37AE/L43A
MSEECEHWLVQRRINDRYWACVDCELEFRPVEGSHTAVNDVVRRALGRIGLDKS